MTENNSFLKSQSAVRISKALESIEEHLQGFDKNSSKKQAQAEVSNAVLESLQNENKSLRRKTDEAKMRIDKLINSLSKKA